jgi:epoxyqueuosine reductase QueG
MFNVLDRHTVGRLLRTKGVDAWGVAANQPRLPGAPAHRIAISTLMRLDPLVVRGLKRGPTREYQHEYDRVNLALDEATETLAQVLRVHGHAAERVTATSDTDTRPFPHKTAATSAGLGWIGKTALFISPEFGPAVRLATVFTDLDLPAGEPVTESLCGTCHACVDACPADCGRDVLWRPGMPRELLFDADACRRHMARFTDLTSDICGICIAACPYALRH